MENLFKQINSALKKYTLGSEDKEDIAQNCMMYCSKNGVTELPASHVKQLVKTQIRLFLRPTYRKINLLMPEGIDYTNVLDNSAVSRIENNILIKQIEKSIMNIKVIPFVYRQAIVYYILEEYTFKEVGEKLGLNEDKIRYYLRSNMDKLEVMLDTELLLKAKQEL